jgi:RHS repeat-associated protein
VANMTSIAAVSGYTGCTQQSLSIIVNGNNQVNEQGFSYDGAGEVLTDGTNTYTWNAEGKIKSVAGVTYAYDGDGHRVQKSNGKLYWYGLSDDPLAETDGTGNLTDEYVFFGGKRIARRDASNNIVFYSADHLGTSRVVTSSTGSILDDSDFYPLGAERPIVSSSGNAYKFTGKEHDAESGLDNFGARHHSSNLGRFMSPDPTPIMAQKLLDPQQWNMYSYARNNPLRLVDTNGKWPTEIHNQIIDAAFPGLSQHQRDVLKNASYKMDHCFTCQSQSHNHEHSMKSPGEDPNSAKQATHDFIAKQETAAQKDQGGTPTKASDINDKSLGDFGKAGHTVTDGTSPAHVDSAGNPKDWNGIPTNPLSPTFGSDMAAIEQHNSEEATISPEQLETAVKALQQAFTNTYGQAAAQQATTPQPAERKDPSAGGGDSGGGQ